MQATWVKITSMGVLLLALGCRTPPPNLKPPPTKEVLATPPSEKRFNSSDYPKEAFNDRDPLKNLNDNGGPIVPTGGKLSSGR